MKYTPKSPAIATADGDKKSEITRIILIPVDPDHPSLGDCAICEGETLVEKSTLALFEACYILAGRGRSGKVEFLVVDSYYISARFDLNQCAKAVEP